MIEFFRVKIFLVILVRKEILEDFLIKCLVLDMSYLIFFLMILLIIIVIWFNLILREWGSIFF